MEFIEKKEITEKGIIWEKRRKDNNFLLFRREYKAGYPAMLPALPYQSTAPKGAVYDKYLSSPVSIETGLLIDLENDGFFKVNFLELPVWNSEGFLVTGTGVYPRKEHYSSYHTAMGDCEPHNYETETEMHEDSYYVSHHYRDGKLYSKERFALDAIFSANHRTKREKDLSLFALCEENLATLKNKVVVQVRQGLRGDFYTYADGDERRAIPCSCSGTGKNDTVKFGKFYRSKLFWNGKDVFQVCTTCGDWEKIF